MNTVCVIVNYNDAATTLLQLNRIADYQNLDAVIVVDNASSDDSLLRLRAAVRGKIILLCADRNGGYGAGNNFGIRYADEVLHARQVLIANPDTAFSDNTVGRMSGFLRRHPGVAVVAPVQKTPGGTVQRNTPGTREHVLAGAAAWPLRPWLYDLLESGPVSRRIFTSLLHYPRRKLKGTGAVLVDCVPGALLMVDVRKFLDAGGYDEAVFLYGEEYMLGSRMKQRGYETALLLGESYDHCHAKTISKRYRTQLARQKLREQATLHYYAAYLHASAWQLFLTRLFYRLIRLELWLFGERG